MKHARLVSLLLILAIALAGCASLRGEKKQGLSRIAQTGEMRIGTSGDQPPLSMTAKNGELLGLDVALARVLAKAMGVEAIFVKRPFGELIEALEDGDVDIVMSGMTITPERTARVTFVGPYYTSGKSMLTRSRELASVQMPSDLDSPTLRVAALRGSTSEAFARKNLPNAKIVTPERLEQAIEKVVNDEVDALIADKETVSFAVLRHPDAGLVASPNTYTIEPLGIAVPPDDPRLANLIQTYFTALGNSGALDKARNYWFLDPSWVQDIR